MNDPTGDISTYARETLGKIPEVVEYLSTIEPELAREQFRENMALYLGRKALPKKILSLIAMAVASANGQKGSVAMHYKLSRKSGAEVSEVIDALKAAKMALMSSTLSTIGDTLPVIEKHREVSGENREMNRIMENLRKESKSDQLPESLVSLSKISFNLFSEHLKEKSELMTPTKLDKKYHFLISYSVSVSLNASECAKIYLSQFYINGGTFPEFEDALAVSRFITGNRALMSASEILKELANRTEPD